MHTFSLSQKQVVSIGHVQKESSYFNVAIMTFAAICIINDIHWILYLHTICRMTVSLGAIG